MKSLNTSKPDKESVVEATENIVRAYFKTWADKDRETIERLLSSDFRFTSPVDDSIDRRTFFEKCWPNSENFVSHDLTSVCVQGNDAFVTYEASTNDGKRFRNTEYLVARGGQIKKIDVYWGWNIPHGSQGRQF